MNSADDVLAKVLEILEEHLSKTTIATFFEDAMAVELTEQKLVIYTPIEYKRSIINKLYMEPFNKALQELFSADVRLEVVSGKNPAETPAVNDGGDTVRNTDMDYTFEKYVVGPSNNFAHAAAMAVAQAPGRRYNPLLIYGGSGLGKTHLLCAIANRIRREQPDLKIIYRTGEQFTNEVISAVRSPDPDATVNFRNLYRQADLLLIDDIQFIAGKDATQDEFFHTFNALYEDHKQIVVSSDRPPKEIYTLEDRIKSRFEAGLIADIQPPDYETRMAILKNKSANMDLDLDEKHMQYIAKNVTSNIRQIEGTIKKIAAMKTLMGMEITQQNISNAIKDILRENPGIKPTANLIIEEVSSFYGIDPDMLRSASRKKEALIPRQVAMYIMQHMAGMSTPAIGREFGKDHSTVLHAISRIEECIRNGKEQKNEVRDIMNNITGH
ncbi:MAG: chromosomal replication initiator protein DnaA [Clostridia bacterium]|nr:chromosomal replication initiator protein DnaA [Clostridia bacterium]